MPYFSSSNTISPAAALARQNESSRLEIYILISTYHALRPLGKIH
jgi:hypothetical protein